MKRNHIHLAQNVAGDGVISGAFIPPKESFISNLISSGFTGMRSSSRVLIYIDVKKSLEAGIKFWLSENGVVLTEGDEKGFLPKRFFDRVMDANEGEITGWR